MGIIDECSKSNNIFYNSITKEKIQNFANEILASRVKPKPNVMIMGTLQMIRFNSQINIQDNVLSSIKSKNNSRVIIKLFDYIYYCNRIESLHNIKQHHINVGYSKMSQLELNNKKHIIFELRNKIEKQIKQLYYD